jgi:hypothetical protein
MNKRYSRFFIRLLNTTVLISMTIYKKNLGCKLDHLKFRMDFTQDLCVKYSIQCQILVS